MTFRDRLAVVLLDLDIGGYRSISRADAMIAALEDADRLIAEGVTFGWPAGCIHCNSPEREGPCFAPSIGRPCMAGRP